jgi:hypothetical protein
MTQPVWASRSPGSSSSSGTNMADFATPTTSSIGLLQQQLQLHTSSSGTMSASSSSSSSASHPLQALHSMESQARTGGGGGLANNELVGLPGGLRVDDKKLFTLNHERLLRKVNPLAGKLCQLLTQNNKAVNMNGGPPNSGSSGGVLTVSDSSGGGSSISINSSSGGGGGGSGLGASSSAASSMYGGGGGGRHRGDNILHTNTNGLEQSMSIESPSPRSVTGGDSRPQSPGQSSPEKPQSTSNDDGDLTSPHSNASRRRHMSGRKVDNVILKTLLSRDDDEEILHQLSLPSSPPSSPPSSSTSKVDAIIAMEMERNEAEPKKPRNGMLKVNITTRTDPGTTCSR